MSRLMLIVVMVVCVGLFSIPVFGQTDVEIPSWVKGVANFWVEDKIDDREFAEALQFLIDSNIIQLGDTKIMSDPVVEENQFGIEDITLQKKYDDAVAYYQKQLTDEREEHEKRINEVMGEYDSVSAELKENHDISEEEKTKLQTEINDLKIKLSEK